MEDKKIRIGLDVHGVIDNIPFFQVIGRLLVNAGHEVHIITGRQWHKIREELADNSIFDHFHYTHHFSITDYLIKNNQKCRWEDPDNPWFDETEWNKAKGEYCEREKIDVHFDDSAEYAEFFKTPIFIRNK